MRLEELRTALRRAPFEPFRIHLSNGESYDVRHSEFASLTRHSIYVGVARQDDIPERTITRDLMHVVAIEPINGAPQDAS